MQKKIRQPITNKSKAAWTMSILAALLVITFFLSFWFGRYGVPPLQVLRILVNQIIPLEQTWEANMATVVLNVRLPRIIMACLVGCCLSVAGAAYQSVFRNPMAAPDILGASSGACLGAALAILLSLGSSVVTGMAFAFSLATVIIVYVIGSRTRGSRTVGIILAGIMISSLCSSGTSYIKLVADPNDQLPAITYWLMGSLNNSDMGEVAFAIIPMLIGLVPLFLIRWQVNLLTLSEEEARSMGVNTNLIRLIVIICATLLTAASVSVSGMIGWVGLVIPHLSRRLVGNDFRMLMPTSMLFGALFLLIVDDIARNLLVTEIPIGILTSVIGAPFFIFLMLRRDEYAV